MAAVAAAHHGMAAARIGTVDALLVGAGDGRRMAVRHALRERWRGAHRVTRWQFNLLQCALAVLTLVAVATLILSGVRYGLLASPDMGVAGPGSGDHTFGWFLDRTASALPRPVVYSLPLWVYRAIMFAWALWVALALARWLRFAWRAWSSGGFWRGEAPTLPAAR